MQLSELNHFCLSLPGATQATLAKPSNVHYFCIGKKQFAYYKTSEPEKGRFSLRVSPERFLELTDQSGIKPARYMGRWHWITIVDVASVQEQHLTELVSWSYEAAS